MADPDDRRRAEGLLEQIADTALDDDYYVVTAGQPQPSREFNTVLTAVVLAAFALVVTMAALQTRSDRPASQRARDTLISDVGARKKLLAARQDTADRLRGQVDELSASVARFDPELEDLRVQTADRAASGPGITVTVSPSDQGNDDGRITDNDLQQLVNGLWYAGAEAVAINGQRIGTLTSIRTAGSAVTVNFKDVGPPYVVVALGDDEALQQRFEDNPAGRSLASRRDNAGVSFSVSPSSNLSVRSAPAGRLTVRHAKAIEGDQ